MWNEIKSKQDLMNFMESHYDFHDSCIKELKYISGAYANDTSMHPINDKRVLNIIIQGQFEYSSVIEMEFIGLKRLSIHPADENYTSEILGATMLLKNDCIYWCDWDGLTEEEINHHNGTVICASSLRWRSADEYLGPNQVYVNTLLKT